LTVLVSFGKLKVLKSSFDERKTYFMRISARLLPLILFLVPLAGFGATLSTLSPNNGSGGIFFNLTAIQSLTVTSFDTYFSGNSGSPVPVAVFARPGTYVGFQSDSFGWALTQTINVTTAGSSSLANILLSSPLNIAAGQTLGIYLQALNSNGIRYQGLGTAATTEFSNADLSMFSAHGRATSEPFAGNLFTPRAFAGNVNYELSSSAVPEPGTITLFSFGLLGALALRKRNTSR
jgi:hypothetical protein